MMLAVVVPDVGHVLVPVPVGTRVGMIAHAPVLARGVWVGHLVVPDNVVAVHRYTVLVAEVGTKPGRGVVHGFREPSRICYEALVLYAYAGTIVAPVPRVPGDVFLQDRLTDEAVRGADGVVGRSLGGGVLEPVEGARPGPLSYMDNYPADWVGIGAVGRSVVVGARRVKEAAGQSSSREGRSICSPSSFVAEEPLLSVPKTCSAKSPPAPIPATAA